MPYVVVAVKGGYKVRKEKPEANGRYRYFSKEPLTQTMAEKQRKALYLAEARKKKSA